MKVFHCDHCQNPVFFENTRCLRCGHALAFLPELDCIGSLEPAGEGLWWSPIPAAEGKTYRLCTNHDEGVCNWAVNSDDDNPLCFSCRLTRVIPDLSAPGNKEAWQKLEIAKRRMLYSLYRLRLPVRSKSEDAEKGLVFEFLADPADPSAAPVITGHANGLITINLKEADDAHREQHRVAMHEPYRTVLGHFRHEIGHYYWEVLLADGPRLEDFRAQFGDERADYSAALQRHYQQGGPSDWQERFISAYASSHPWEDWAETWAHYLHMVDALETAAATGLNLRPPKAQDPSLHIEPHGQPPSSFEGMVESWFPLTYVLNSLNRGLGLPDGYPFVLSATVIDKLRFVHDTIEQARDR
jgi:hypothetical protein